MMRLLVVEPLVASKSAVAAEKGHGLMSELPLKHVWAIVSHHKAAVVRVVTGLAMLPRAILVRFGL